MSAAGYSSSNSMWLLGHWSNELGSQMEIQSIAADGTIVGLYNSTVGETSGKWYPLRGLASSTGNTCSFVVGWDDSSTAWAGVRLDDSTLSTTWVLSVPTDEWKAYRVNKNVFRKHAM